MRAGDQNRPHPPGTPHVQTCSKNAGQPGFVTASAHLVAEMLEDPAEHGLDGGAGHRPAAEALLSRVRSELRQMEGHLRHGAWLTTRVQATLTLLGACSGHKPSQACETDCVLAICPP